MWNSTKSALSNCRHVFEVRPLIKLRLLPVPMIATASASVQSDLVLLVRVLRMGRFTDFSIVFLVYDATREVF